MKTRIRSFAGLSLAGLLLLTACGGMDEAAEEAVDDVPIDPDEIEELIVEEAESANEDEDEEDDLDDTILPSCDEIRSLIGMDELVNAPGDDDEEDRYENPMGFGINCAWFTPDTFEKANLKEAFADPGEALSVSLLIEESVLDMEDAREFGFVAEDPRLDDYGGYVDISLIGDSYDVNAPLSLTSPPIYIGRFSAYIATMNGLLIAEQNQLTELTNSWAIDQAIAIYDSL